jgi:hypothetical protein
LIWLFYTGVGKFWVGLGLGNGLRLMCMLFKICGWGGGRNGIGKPCFGRKKLACCWNCIGGLWLGTLFGLGWFIFRYRVLAGKWVVLKNIWLDIP